MQFNVGQLLKDGVGAKRHYDVEEQVSRLEPDVRGVSPLRGTVALLHSVQGVLCTGTLRCRVELSCGRCLDTLERDIVLQLEEEFSLPSPDATEHRVEDPVLVISEQNILDISEVVRQNLMLALPTHPLCRPDCRGLCLNCGENLNQDECACPPASVDPRWSMLRAWQEKNEHTGKQIT